MDFLERYEFLVDTKKRRLTLKETSYYTKGKESHISSLNLIQTPPVTTAKFQDILAEFPNLTKPNSQPSKDKLKLVSALAVNHFYLFQLTLISQLPLIVEIVKYSCAW
ncbi:unnamed protein product [Schistosoma guineensis]|nr:unnamed protein product [Schistosoma guineensis]